MDVPERQCDYIIQKGVLANTRCKRNTSKGSHLCRLHYRDDFLSSLPKRYALCNFISNSYHQLDWDKVIGWTTDKELAKRFEKEQPKCYKYSKYSKNPYTSEESYWFRLDPTDTHMYHKRLIDGSCDGNETGKSPDMEGWEFIESYTIDGGDILERINRSTVNEDLKIRMRKQHQQIDGEYNLSDTGVFIDTKTRIVIKMHTDLIELLDSLVFTSYTYLNLEDSYFRTDDQVYVKDGDFATVSEIPDIEITSWEQLVGLLDN